MGADIEQKLKTQTDGEQRASGNIINDKRTATFHSSEDVGVIEVNWKGLYQDCKYAWISVGIFMILMLYGVWSLSSKGYFESKKIDEEVAKVRILEVTNYFGKKILIAGDVTNNIPVEVRLPQKCVVDPRWIGSEVELHATRYQNNQTKVASFKFTGVENLCDSTEGYLKEKVEREKMKNLVQKISSYDLIPDVIKSDEKIEVPVAPIALDNPVINVSTKNEVVPSETKASKNIDVINKVDVKKEMVEKKTSEKPKNEVIKEIKTKSLPEVKVERKQELNDSKLNIS